MKKIYPPKYATENAKKALKCISQGSNAMTKVGRARMNQLINRKPLTKKDLIDIHKFRRHFKNAFYKGNPCKDNGYVSWMGWGYGFKNGKPNLSFGNWAKRKLKGENKK